jgi:hypothetical protein
MASSPDEPDRRDEESPEEAQERDPQAPGVGAVDRELDGDEPLPEPNEPG